LQLLKKKNMLKSWLSVGLVSFMLIGCAESTPDTEAESESEAPSAAVEESASPAEAPIEYSVTEAPVVKEKVIAPTAGLNPAHGQPGHNCDIAVGAPLDGSGGVQTQAPQSFTPNLATQPLPQVQSGAKGLNPAHGQPGHNCDIAVGAPL
jgi:hypothetical protein